MSRKSRERMGPGRARSAPGEDSGRQLRRGSTTPPPSKPPMTGLPPAPVSDDQGGDRCLWLHLVSMHADPMAVCRTAAENDDQHEHEHRGPGTIRNHPAGDLGYNLTSAK